MIPDALCPVVAIVLPALVLGPCAARGEPLMSGLRSGPVKYPPGHMLPLIIILSSLTRG